MVAASIIWSLTLFVASTLMQRASLRSSFEAHLQHTPTNDSLNIIAQIGLWLGSVRFLSTGLLRFG